jgi:hypothetical protein
MMKGLMSDLDQSTRISGPEIFIHLPGANAPSRSCTVLGIAHGQMHIRTDRWIEPATLVLAVFARITLAGEVVYCTRKDSWYRACIGVISEDDQRREPRLSVRQPGTINALADNGNESAEGTLLDLSVSGMRVEVPHRIQPGTMILVETRSAVVAGEVRHCLKGRDGRFEAGIEITDILSGLEGKEKSLGVVRRIRRKLAQAISGEPIVFTRSLI